MIINIEDLIINKFIFDNGNKNANFFSYKQDNNEEMEAYEN